MRSQMAEQASQQSNHSTKNLYMSIYGLRRGVRRASAGASAAAQARQPQRAAQPDKRHDKPCNDRDTILQSISRVPTRRGGCCGSLDSMLKLLMDMPAMLKTSMTMEIGASE